MRYLSCGLAAAVFLSCGGAAGAAPSPVPPAAQSEEAQYQRLQNWLAETAAWTQGYDALTTRQADTLAWLLDGSEILVGKLESGGSAAARAWATTWAVEARARLEADMTAYTLLSPHAPTYPRDLPTTPVLRGRIEVINRMSDQVGSMMLTARQASEDYIQVMEAAASGRDEDLARVDPARLGLLAAQLQAEITMMQSSSAGLNGPGQHLAGIAIEGNRALIVWLNHNSRVFGGQTSDAAAAAGAMREHSAAMRQELGSMRRSVDDTRRQLAAETGPDAAALIDVLQQLLTSYATSAEVEARMADALDQLAVAVSSADEAAAAVAAGKIEALAGQRLALDGARRELVARSGGLTPEG